eukprot:TRINITY_DN26728_c0_g1_i1.p1 TRINITY_DN26728_c0_g1~~TRINITY_DN26728_c0_g1_i1.p1  ORF type:complete len:451 (+),score=81.90 TRINITY_DN26728_c0_g1_i1:96-1448(+)
MVRWLPVLCPLAGLAVWLWAAVVRPAEGGLTSLSYGQSYDRAWLKQLLQDRAWKGGGPFLDVGGANPKPCFTNGLYKPGDAVADVTRLSSFCFTEEDRQRITLLRVDFEEDWSAIDAHVAKHGKFDFAVTLHTLEDLDNPRYVAKRLPTVAHAGVLVTPSKYVELYDFELNVLAGQGLLSRVGPWASGWRGYYHHRWIFTVKAGSVIAIPKTPMLERDPTLSNLTSYAMRSCYDELRIFWEGDLPLMMPPSRGAIGTIMAYRTLLANEEEDAERDKECQTMMAGRRELDFTRPESNAYGALQLRVWSGAGDLCLALEEVAAGTGGGKDGQASGNLYVQPCKACRDRWHLGDEGKLQDMSKPGHCLGGAAAGGLATAVPCPSSATDSIILPTVMEGWFLVKSAEVSNTCLGVDAQTLSVVWRSCILRGPDDAWEVLYWRLRGGGLKESSQA